MPVSVILENLEAGANIDDIMQWFEGLDRDGKMKLSERSSKGISRLLSKGRGGSVVEQPIRNRSDQRRRTFPNFA
jgi:hypothetical protein